MRLREDRGRPRPAQADGDDRNVALAERIDALHAQGRRVFVAVGSLHMGGGTGLPKLLADKGFAVERVNLRPR